MTIDTVFHDFIKIGIRLHVDSLGKKHATGMPRKWTDIKHTIYNGEPNYSILTGQINDIIVIDLDNKGDFPAKEWFETHFFKLDTELTNTIVTRTINGGYHVYFKWSPLVSNHNDYLGQHIDILVDRKCVYEGQRLHYYIQYLQHY